MIVRILRAWSTDADADADAYAEYLDETVVSALEHARGNVGVMVLWRTIDDRAEFLLCSVWKSSAAADEFAAAGGMDALDDAGDLATEVALEAEDYKFYVRGDLALVAGLSADG